MASGITPWDWMQLRYMDFKDFCMKLSERSENFWEGVLGGPAENAKYSEFMEIYGAYEKKLKDKWEEKRKKLEQIKHDKKFHFYDVRIETWHREFGPPAANSYSTTGCIIDKDGTRRNPIDREILFSSNYKKNKVASIHSVYDYVSFVVAKDYFYSPSTTYRLFIMKPGAVVEFYKDDKDGCYFILKSKEGSLVEDKDFRTAKEFDAVMSFYSCVSDAWMGTLIKAQVNFLKNSSTKDTLADQDFLADRVIESITAGSVAFGILCSMAPAVMLPAEFAFNLFQTMLKALMAYAISYCYGKESAGDELKNDLYILFADDDVDISLGKVAEAMIDAKTSVSGNIFDNLSKEKLWERAGKSKIGTYITSKLSDKVTAKLTTKGITEKGVPVVAQTYGAYLNAKEAFNFGAQAKKYYRPEPPTIKISFDANGGFVPPIGKIIKKGSPSPYRDLLSPGVNKKGCFFAGWYTAPEGGTRVTEVVNAREDITLYAHWKPEIIIKVKFDSNGGSAPNPADKEFHLGGFYGDAYGTLATVEKRTGYEFKGWFTEREGGTPVNDRTLVENQKNHTLYAHWKANPVKVTFDANGGGTPKPSSMNVTFGSEYGTLPTASKTGCKVSGWFTAAKNGSEIKSTDKVNNSKEHTLYAHWEAKTIKVSFDARGVTPNPSSRDLAFGSEYGTLPTVTKPGYKFEGWFIGAKGGTPLKASKKMHIELNHTLYAHWSVLVTFDANGGKPSPEDKVINNPGSPYGTLPTVSKSGYKFEGWYTSAIGGTEVKSSTKAPDKPHTLYAHWSILVTFDANGGKAPSPASKSVNVGSSYGPLPAVTKSGSKFEGWFTAVKGGTEVKSSTKAPDKPHTLYAHWTDISTLVTFEANGGNKPSPATKDVKIGSAYGPLPTVARDKYKFEGWFTAAKSGTEVKSTTKAPEKDHTLYAHWSEPKPTSVKVAFDANGGSKPSSAIKELKIGSAYGTLPTVARSGYDFGGWFDKASGGAEVKSTSKAPEKDHTLYAHWSVPKPISVKVTFDANGGSKPSTASKTVNAGSAYGPLPTVTRDKYKFEGWFTAAKSGTEIKSSTKVPDKAHTLYAHWSEPKPTSVKVTFEANDGNKPSPATKDVKIGSTYGPLPTVSRDKYKFEGWFTAAKSGTQVKSSTKAPEKAHTLYAHWSEPKPINVKVTFEANGGKAPSPASKLVNIGSAYGPLPTVTKPGYKFEGWFTAAKSGTEVKATTKVPDKAHTLYAHWSEVITSVKVTFEANGGSKPSPASKDVKIGSAYGPLPTVTKPGYKFDGWFTSAKSGTEVKSTSKAPDKAHTLYAHWSEPKPASVKVTFDANGGKAPSPASKTVNAGSAYGPLPTVTRDKYKFEGWFTAAKSGTEVKSSTKAPDKNHTLYAHWSEPKPASVKVAFDANGGKAPSPASKTVNAGSAYGSLPTVTRDKYKFEGWFTAAKSGTEVKSSTKAPEKAHTLYAHWSVPKPISVKVTFDANGGKAPSPASREVKIGSKYDTLPTVTRDKYKFEGWFTAAKSGTEVKSSTKAPDKAHTLYAHWTAPLPPPKPNPTPKPDPKPTPKPDPKPTPKPDPTPASKKYKVGDTGPGGGIVFYAPYIGGFKCKECSKMDLGKISRDQAVKLAKDFRGGGKTDWRLPTDNELNGMREDLHKKGLGGFKNDSYWFLESSEKYGTDLYSMNFQYEKRNFSTGGDGPHYVRAVREFD